ncbi:PIR Superfamily Protein [Plasmodium ovale curtisi]|uniref:PIR Superfamily Protein n=1 Tax=Plasmodium ovale curtisi TaxID=864141 RepID=A0A1A8WLE5_PLAOA|nr:PIR Superfamily Protein [Plasmodium ovale curtisi]
MASESIPYSFVSLFSDYSEKFKQVVTQDKEVIPYEAQCGQMKMRLFQSNLFNKEHCQNNLKYIKHLSNQNPDNETNKRCSYFNYILNCEANDLIPKDYRSNYIDSYLLLLSNYKNVCYLSIELIEEDVFEKIKNIHNMYELLNKVKPHTTTCTDECCANAKKCAVTYERHIHNCYDDSTDNFCLELAKIKAVYEKYMKTAIKTCTDAKELLTPPMQNNSGVSILISCTILLVIPFILFVSYKFTPLSSWISPRIHKLKRIFNNTDGKNKNLILDNFELTPCHQKKEPYLIAYNSS